MRVYIGPAIAKATAARFMPNGTDDDLPVHVVWRGGSLERPQITTYGLREEGSENVPGFEAPECASFHAIWQYLGELSCHYTRNA